MLKNTFSKDITISDLKSFLTENKNNWITGFKSYVSDYVKQVLTEETKNEFSKEDFHSLECHTAILIKYAEILKKYRNNFSYLFLESIIFWQSPEEFEKMCNN